MSFVIGFLLGCVCGVVGLFWYAIRGECKPVPMREPLTPDENAGIPTG